MPRWRSGGSRNRIRRAPETTAKKSKAAHMAYRAIIEHEPPQTWKNGGLTSILGYSGVF
jgi:hypothetical protein